MDIGKKCAKFDFGKFFFDESDDEFSAIMIITPRQNICFSAEYHAKGAAEIMSEVYGENFDFSSEDYWPEIVNEYGCVAVQILKRGFVIVNFPSVVNEFQFNELFDFYQKLMKVNNELRKKGEEPLEFHSNVFSGGNNLSFGRALMAYKKRVTEFEPREEKMVEKNVKTVYCLQF